MEALASYAFHHSGATSFVLLPAALACSPPQFEFSPIPLAVSNPSTLPLPTSAAAAAPRSSAAMPWTDLHRHLSGALSDALMGTLRALTNVTNEAPAAWEAVRRCGGMHELRRALRILTHYDVSQKLCVVLDLRE